MNKKITILFFVGLFLWACYETEVSFRSLINGFADVNFFISEMFPPDFSEVSKVFPDFITTLKMAFVSTFYGAFLAYPIAIFAANTVTKTKFLLLSHLSIYLFKSSICFVLFFTSYFSCPKCHVPSVKSQVSSPKCQVPSGKSQVPRP